MISVLFQTLSEVLEYIYTCKELNLTNYMLEWSDHLLKQWCPLLYYWYFSKLTALAVNKAVSQAFLTSVDENLNILILPSTWEILMHMEFWTVKDVTLDIIMISENTSTSSLLS